MSATDRTCSKKTCTSGKVGQWMPVLRMYALKAPQIPQYGAEFELKLLLCSECKETAKAADFIDDKNWPVILKVFQSRGLRAPDRKSVFLTFEEAARVQVQP